MKYKFRCEKCNKTIEKEMSIKEYEEFDPKCEKCGEEMERIYESPTLGCGVGGTGQDSGGFSCSGGCATCPGCG